MTSPSAPGSPRAAAATLAGSGPIVLMDVGNVLLPVAASAHVRRLAVESGLSPTHVREAIHGARLEERFESGRLSVAELVGEVRRALAAPHLADRVVQEAWDAVVDTTPDPVMTSVARRLAASGRLLLASNTNVSHWAVIEPKLARCGLRAPAALSFRLGVMKPDPAFFERLADRLGRRGGPLVFLDDRAENVAAARGAGVAGWVHHDAADSRSRLEELLPEVLGGPSRLRGERGHPGA